MKLRIIKRAAAWKDTQLAGRKQANVGRRLAGSQSKSDKSVSSLARSLDDPKTRRATTPINIKWAGSVQRGEANQLVGEAKASQNKASVKRESKHNHKACQEQAALLGRANSKTSVSGSSTTTGLVTPSVNMTRSLARRNGRHRISVIGRVAHVTGFNS
jgi:hypothetical protein